MGHIAHLRNQFKSRNTFEQRYDSIYYKIGPVGQDLNISKYRECTFRNFINISLCEKVSLFHLKQLKSSSHGGGMLFANFD